MLLQNLQAELAEILLANDQNTDLLQPVKHLSIYQNNILASLVRTLKDIYPLITKLLGDEYFQLTAKEYIKHYPSRSSNLHEYGEYFSDFLAEYPPLKNLIYLAEVAQFEWICHILFFSADHVGLDTKQLESVPPEQYNQLHFNLHPASKLMKSHYPLLRIIDLCKEEIDGTIDLSEEGVNLLIIRRHLEIMLVTLTAAEYAFLNALQEGKSLSEALNEAFAVDANFKLDEKLPLWIQNKTLVDYYLA